MTPRDKALALLKGIGLLMQTGPTIVNAACGCDLAPYEYLTVIKALAALDQKAIHGALKDEQEMATVDLIVEELLLQVTQTLAEPLPAVEVKGPEGEQ